MIQNIIFDFGDVFINLDKPAILKTMTEKFGSFELSPEMLYMNDAYEMGKMTSAEFVQFYQNQFPDGQTSDFLTAWNSILLDIPDHRLKFLEELAKSNRYNIFLLSNTNEIHINYVIETYTPEKFARFKNCFKTFYLSYEMGKRKPNADIFEQVLQEQNLIPDETLFIDDTAEHIATAASLGIHTWNLTPGKDDVTQLFDQPFPFKQHL